MADQDNNGAEAPIPTNNTSIFTSNVPLPPKIQLKGNLANNWKTWKQIWDAYELVTKNKEQSHQYRVATFITVIGREAIEITGSPSSLLLENKIFVVYINKLS